MALLICLTMIVALILVPQPQKSGSSMLDNVVAKSPKSTFTVYQAPKLLMPSSPSERLHPSLVKPNVMKPNTSVVEARRLAPSVERTKRQDRVKSSQSKSSPKQTGSHRMSDGTKEALAYRHAQGSVVPLAGEALHLSILADRRITQAANRWELANDTPGKF